MPWAAPLIGAGGSIISGLIGAGSASAGQQQALALAQQSVKDFEAIGVPTAEAMQLTLQKYQSAGQLTPELEQALSQGPTQLSSIQTDPNLKAAQMQALNQLQTLGSNGGMQLSDQAALQGTMGNIQATEKGSRDAIMQNMAQRNGGYGSGAALAAQLANSQNAATNENSAGLNTAAQAQARALQAIMSAGSLGNQMQQTDYNQKANAASAQDAINSWNAQNAQNVQNTNVGYHNTAQSGNLANAQNLSNANTDTANKQTAYNSQLPQQVYQDQLAKAQSTANARAGQASQTNANAQSAANMWGGIGSSVAQGAAAYNQNQNTNQTNTSNNPLANVNSLPAIKYSGNQVPSNGKDDEYIG